MKHITSHKKRIRTQIQKGVGNVNAIKRSQIDEKVLVEAVSKAIVQAEREITEQREKEMAERQELQQRNWEKTLHAGKYTGDNAFGKALDKLSLPFRLLWGIVFFKEENATQANATFALLRLCNNGLLFMYQWVLYIIAFLNVLAFLVYGTEFFETGLPGHFQRWVYLSFAFLSFIVAQIVRVAKLEARNSCNKDAIIMVFNAVVGFTAMVFSVAAVLISIYLK